MALSLALLGDSLGLFGTPASVIIDVNLIIQWVVFVIILLGYVKKKPLETHGRLMVTVTIINLLTVLLIMGPSLILNWGLLPLEVLPHSAVGIIAIILGLLFGFRFLMATRTGEPLACGNRRMMRIAFVLWIVPVFFGTFLYFSIYIM
ncbi:MAG: hypothetical protein ACXADF_12710 [Candidatus Thorarchaeota archaeon]|jgi:uncharacterized membrane protein YozB (DUF420 family)